VRGRRGVGDVEVLELLREARRSIDENGYDHLQWSECAVGHVYRVWNGGVPGAPEEVYSEDAPDFEAALRALTPGTSFFSPTTAVSVAISSRGSEGEGAYAEAARDLFDEAITRLEADAGLAA
jgi:hypothetical protein